MSKVKQNLYQSARMMFRGKDHKDIYFVDPKPFSNEDKNKFCCAIYIKDADPSVEDIIWRKKFKNRYFWYMTLGYYDNEGFSGICYCDVKNLSHSNFHYGQFSIINAEYVVTTERWTDWIDVWSKDCKYINAQDRLPFDCINPVGFANGLLIRRYLSDIEYDYYFITFKDKPKLGKRVVDQIVKAGDDASAISYHYTLRDGTVTFSVVRDYSIDVRNDEDKTVIYDIYEGFKCWSSETFKSWNFRVNRKSNQVVSYQSYIVGANGRAFIVCSMVIYKDNNYKEEKYRCVGLVEVINHSVRDKRIKEIFNYPDDCSSFSSMAMRYCSANDTYYIYVTYSVKGNNSYYKTYIYTTKNFMDFTRHELPEKITIKHLLDDSFEPMELYFEGESLSGKILFYSGNFENYFYPIYDNNSVVKNSSDAAFGLVPSENGVIIYMKNLLFTESDDNFYFRSKQARSSIYSSGCVDKFGMYKKYYEEYDKGEK